MERSGLINKVKIKMDELTPDGVALPFDESIGPILDECAREILEKAPLHLLTPTAIPLTTVVYHNDRAYIPVPTDYVRLYEIKYPLWKKSVRRAISTEDPSYKIQENEYLASGYGRPSVIILTTSVNSGAVTKYFECSKVLNPGAGTLAPVALYVKTEKPEALNDIFADSISWLCASKILLINGYMDKAKLAFEQYGNTITGLETT